MLSVAVTGNVASGKSTVVRFFERWGARVTDADAIVRQLQSPGTPVFDAIVARFGAGVVGADGALDRVALRTLVLADPAARRDLNAIVHPAVGARRAELEAEARLQGVSILVHDIPLLFEAADPGRFDLVVLVEAPPALCRDRLIRFRELTPDVADRLMATQLPQETKRARSHFVIVNDGDLVALELRARQVWQGIEAAAAERA